MNTETQFPIDGTACELDLDAIERENEAGGYIPHLKVAEFCAAICVGLLVGFLLAGGAA